MNMEGLLVTEAYPHLFSPLQVGTMALRSRVMLPPHASAIGNIYGTDEDAARNIAYFEQRARAGVAWVGSLSTHLRNSVIPGFEPSGVGAATTGFFRLPFYVERVQAFSDAMHALDTTVTVQMVHQGGMPHGPSHVMSAPTINLMPHVMDQDDIDTFVREYAESAVLSQQGRADGVELHLNHDDLHEWFLSPLTNHREDGYGGSLEGRARFSVECIRAIREAVGDTMTVGVRLNIREELPGGYDTDGGIAIAQYLESTGLIDYVHGVIGTPWGNPSYIQPTYFEPGPVVLPRRAAEGRDLAAGDPHRPGHRPRRRRADHRRRARRHRRDGPRAHRRRRPAHQGARGPRARRASLRRRQRVHQPAVRRGAALRLRGEPRHQPRGRGPVADAGTGSEAAGRRRRARRHGARGAQRRGRDGRRAARGGRDARRAAPLRRRRCRGTRASSATSTGRCAGSRPPACGCTPAPGSARTTCSRAVPTWSPSRPVPDPAGPAYRGWTRSTSARSGPCSPGEAEVGERVLVVAQDDHVPPLSVADFLAQQGKQVTVVYATHQPAPLLGRYYIGAILGRLDAAGARFVFMEEVVGIDRHSVTTRHVYSGQERTLGEFDSVVLACGSVSDASLYDELRGRHPELHVLGDAYAPRRLVFATRQAWALAQQIVTAGSVLEPA